MVWVDQAIAFERERARLERSRKAKAISEKASPAKARKKAKNDALILSAIHTYRKAHPTASTHEIATVVARRVKRSVSAVKKRLT